MTETEVHLEVPSDLDLTQFLAANPGASVASSAERGWVVKTPWGDPSFELHIGGPEDPSIGFLNAVQLPPRFAAIRHADTSDVEFIYTAGPLDEGLSGRAFAISYQEHEYQCEFAPASERLIEFAKSIHPIGPSTTDYRHLLALNFHFAHALEHEHAELPAVFSFWIRDAPLNDSDLVALCGALNFYMSYYDRHGPTIDIYPPPDEALGELDHLARYPLGTFPDHIAAGPSDDYVRLLWQDARQTPTALSFIHCYQILEYLAFYLVKDDLSHEIRRILLAPHAMSEIEVTLRSITEAFTAEQQSNESKIDALVKRMVDPRTLWPFRQRRRETFSTKTSFDGGVTLDPLITADTTLEQWCATWHPGLISKLRVARNALVHGRERRVAHVIANPRRYAPSPPLA